MVGDASSPLSDVAVRLKKKAPVENHRGQTNPAQVS
jgi:hypothetical protein